MSYGYYNDGSGRQADGVPGARRQKVFGYIKAANELRQSYQAQIQSQLRGDDTEDMPGGFPDADIVRSGDEEMLLFPSYAHKHIKRRRQEILNGEEIPGSHEYIDRSGDTGDADYWRREWEKYEDANAIVDVDVRGWLYSPQKGPMSKRNRLLLAVARRLSGIPAPDPSPAASRDPSLGPSHRNRIHDGMMSHEEEAAAREADLIAQRGQKEADAAWRGTYNADANRNGNGSGSRPDSPSRSSTRSDLSDDSSLYSLSSRLTWNQTTEMSRDELVKANEQLMTRLRPFMTLPLASTPITVFFYNDEKSISKTIYTDESGHFNLRAALNFVPSKVRVLVSEKLSAVEDVIITETEGISLISDIDDTIKHSAIASGAREIFKNTFVKDLSELTIHGVKEWYNKMAKMGVKMHYVSNSPWQLYPLLKSYFALAGMPPGSIHLKQYSGMLQGIFEPAAERKKVSLEKIFYDFPERKFILVGDSGEADLEVYTDVVLANPGRVLGVFIRDVTTPEKKSFFDQTSSYATSQNNSSTLYAQFHVPSTRPALPTRTKTEPPKVEEDLIDFSDDVSGPEPSSKSSGYESDMQQLQDSSGGRPPPPNKPAKPSNLRSFSTASPQPISNQHDRVNATPSPEAKRPPPLPKPRRTSTSVSQASAPPESPRQAFSTPQQYQSPPRRPGMDSRTSSSYSLRNEDEGYVASARRHINTAYNALPALRAQSPTRDSFDPKAPPPPPRRGLSAYPAAAARWATGATGGDPAAGGDGGAAPMAPYNKKEEFWKRRWSRAEEIMRSKRVVLKTWRVGSDVMDECVRLAENATRDSHRQQRNNGGHEYGNMQHRS